MHISRLDCGNVQFGGRFPPGTANGRTGGPPGHVGDPVVANKGCYSSSLQFEDRSQSYSLYKVGNCI